MLKFAWLIPVAACAAPAVQVANPASQYCASLGGATRIVATPDGEVGYCDLPDGRSIDEWDLFRASQRAN
ncbi:DUF333 domain-containing protein [Paracoccus sp. (in: a-proteobacteria)]|uniref:DUF333 domain-containing protein n=1 Tax=Paracoccus sp. TaxID=267 RepID=UPI0026DFEC53|nr:DUF333 domain-containing protein [Paracoccus sp. (in: a-proteobacteria)]MDO5648533.1 DUF333 domain-containing protein [Paracoccus sp. (in: a-proteobacteria)]